MHRRGFAPGEDARGRVDPALIANGRSQKPGRRQVKPLETLKLSRSIGKSWILGLGIVLVCLGIGPSAAIAVPQEKDPEAEPVEVKPPELHRARVMSPEPICLRPSTVVCEDFEKPDRSRWGDYNDTAFYIEDDVSFSGERAMRQYYDRGQAVAGWLSWHFGDHPDSRARKDATFEEIYFRFYHRFQRNWPNQFFPPKLARVRSRYVEGDLLYAWEEQLMVSARMPGGTAISLPISGLAEPGGTKHQGDGKVRWLEREALDLRFAEHTGQWVAIEMRVKLNTPGQNDGRITYWVNGKLALDRTGLNLRGAYTATTINEARLEAYWSGGAPRDELMRWFDNVVVATEPVGCVTFTVRKKELEDQSAWHLQIATAPSESAVVWDSGNVPGVGTQIDISEQAGTFADGAERCLRPSDEYVMRAKHAVGETWSEWSEWKPMFK